MTEFLHWAASLEPGPVLAALGEMSLQGAVLIAAVLVLRALFRRRMSPVALYALWLLPAARLLIPGSVGSAFSFLNLLPFLQRPSARQTLPGATPAGEGVFYPAFETTLPPGASILDAAPPPAAPAASFDGAALLPAVWLTGAAVVLAFALWRNVSFVGRAKRDAVAVETDGPLPVYLSETVSSPCLCGLFRPVILVNDSVLQNETHLDMALRHELAHWRAGDRYWALLRLACCAVHWFDPLVWIAAAASVQDCERACDHRVLHRTDQGEREEYGLLLLSYLKQPAARYSLLCASSPMGGGKQSLRRRIESVAKCPKTKKTAAAALAACVLLACLVACTGQMNRGELYLQAADAARKADVVTISGTGSTVSGGTLANYLEGRDWEKRDDVTSYNATDIIQYQIPDENGNTAYTLTFFHIVGDGACYASVHDVTDAGGVRAQWAYYEISEKDTSIAYVLRHLGGPAVIQASYGESGEIAMVTTRPNMEDQYHYFFRSNDGGESYTYVESDLDALFPGIAQQMYFVSIDVGFVGFAYETRDALEPPHLYRTGNGGRNWERVELPMADVTIENGYGGIYVSDIAFTDSRNGCVVVSCNYGGNPLSVSFYTADGGRTWSGVTSSGPMRTYDPEDPKSAYLAQQDITLTVGETYRLNVRGITPEITWTSSDESVATVDGTGCVTAVAPGRAAVTAAWGGVSYDCTVRVASKEHSDSAVQVLARLSAGVSYDERRHRVSFTIPEDCDVSALTLQVNGKTAADGPALQYMENAELAAGRQYTLDLGENALVELWLEASYQGQTLVLDLLPLLREEAPEAARIYPAALTD